MGSPTALARPRFSGTGRVYDAQKHIKTRAEITVLSQATGLKKLCGPIRMNVLFVMPFPVRTRKTTQEAIKSAYHDHRPDLSNLLKFIEDIVAPVLFEKKDDCIIASVVMEKIYDDGNGARTEFYFEELPNKKLIESPLSGTCAF